jgi:hypothetical protein
MTSANFFEISLNTFNLFSMMMGMSLVVLSSYWNGRIKYTRIVFMYLAGLAFYYGFIKPVNNVEQALNKSALTSQNFVPSNTEARVPSALEVTGRGRKQ